MAYSIMPTFLYVVCGLGSDGRSERRYDDRRGDGFCLLLQATGDQKQRDDEYAMRSIAGISGHRIYLAQFDTTASAVQQRTRYPFLHDKN